MIRYLAKFRKNEDGAVTVDWVVLTAGIVGLSIGMYGALEQNVFNLGDAAANAVGDEDDF